MGQRKIMKTNVTTMQIPPVKFHGRTTSHDQQVMIQQGQDQQSKQPVTIGPRMMLSGTQCQIYSTRGTTCFMVG